MRLFSADVPTCSRSHAATSKLLNRIVVAVVRVVVAADTDPEQPGREAADFAVVVFFGGVEAKPDKTPLLGVAFREEEADEFRQVLVYRDKPAPGHGLAVKDLVIRDRQEARGEAASGPAPWENKDIAFAQLSSRDPIQLHTPW